MDSQQYSYQGFTLIDITPTGQTTYLPTKELERNQQRNWETIQQIINLRTQTEIIKTDNFLADVSDYSFGINHKGKHNIWTFVFSVEHTDIYKDGPDIFGLLKYDFKIIPVVTGLTETIKLEQPIFDVSGPGNNIYFKSIKV